MKPFFVLTIAAYLCVATYGYALSGAGYGASQYSAVEQHSESSSNQAAGLGGFAGGYGASSVSSRSSYSSVSSSSSNIYEQWPQLGGHSWFAQIAGLASNYKSAGIAGQLITQGFNFESTISELYSRNQFLEQYMFAATGIRYDSVTTRSKFFSIIQQNPGCFLRSLRFFARHPGIFQSQLAQTIISTTSVEIFQSYNQQSALSFFQSGYGINKFLEYSSFRTSLATVFNVQPEISILRSVLSQYYQRNALGTLLLFRHILTRKTLYSIDQYLGFDYQVYSSRYVNQRIWRHNPYYDSYYGSSTTQVSSVSSVSSSSSLGTTGLGIGSTGLGIGSTGLGIGSTGLGVGSASSYQASSYQSRSAVSSGVGGISGIGGYGGYNSGVSTSSSSYSSTTVSSSSILQQWPQLCGNQWFGKVVGLASTYKSAGIGGQLITQGFNFESTITDLYSRNQFLEQYIWAATGIRYDSITTRSKFFSIIQQSPGTFLRSLRYFARHPGIFQSQLAQSIISTTSIEIFQSYNQQSALSFFQSGYGINQFLEYSSFRTSLATIFNVQPEISILRSVLSQYYQRNALGTLLLFRHILTRKTLYSLDQYLGFDYQVYSSRYVNQRIWRHNPYYDSFYGASASAVSSSTQISSVSSSSSVGSTGLGYGGIPGGIAGGIAGSSYQSSSYQKTSVTTTSIASQWPQLGGVPFFQKACGLASSYKSQAIAGQLISSDFDFYSTFSSMYSKNALLEQYISAATGISCTSVESRRSFFGLVQRNPGSFLRLFRCFARRPAFFQSQLAQTLITKTSIEIFQSYNQQSALQLFQPGYGINKFFEYSSYRSSLATFFGCSTDISVVSSAFQQYYYQNPYGSLLLLRHILTNRQLYSYDEYLSFDYEVYSSRYASRRLWRRNPYFDEYQSMSSSSTTVRSSSFGARSAGGYGGYGGYGAFGGASSYQQSSASSRSLRSVRSAGF